MLATPMANHTYQPRPQSAGMPRRTAPCPSPKHRSEPSGRHQSLTPTPEEHDVDPRLLFANKFWGRRRYSDSVSQLPKHLLTAQVLRYHDYETSSSVIGRCVPHHSCYEPPATPTSIQSLQFPASPTHQRSDRRQNAHQLSQLSVTTPIDFSFTPSTHLAVSPEKRRFFQTFPLSASSFSCSSTPRLPHWQEPSVQPQPDVRQFYPAHAPRPSRSAFLHVPGYASYEIHPRQPTPLPTRRDDLAKALSHIHAEVGPVSLRGVGALARAGGPLCGSTRGRLARSLGDFLDRAERSLLLPVPVPDPDPVPVSGSVVDVRAISPGLKSARSGWDRCKDSVWTQLSVTEEVQPKVVDQRKLRRLESELFDTTKYVDVGGEGKYLTVFTWSEGNSFGTITLFDVDVERPALRTASRGVAVTGLAARRKLAPRALYTGRGQGKAISMRPVAAMEDVPQQVLVNMRIDHRVKKAVLQHDQETGRFRWKANHARQGQLPNFVRALPITESRRVHTTTSTSFGDDVHHSLIGRAPTREEGRRLKSSMGVENAREFAATRRNVSPDLNNDSRYVQGMVATIPQFLALIHSNMSVIDETFSAPATEQLVETEDGERLRSVSLIYPPKGPRHRGRDVHVVVLVPDGAKWAAERIFWADDNGALAELRQKRHQAVIDSPSGRTGRQRMAYAWKQDVRSLGPLSAPLGI